MDPGLINLLNFQNGEFSSSQYVLTSPRSLRACRNLHIRPSDLIYLPLDYFETKHCHLSQSKCNEIFINHENLRQGNIPINGFNESELIRSCIEERNRIINFEEKHKPVSCNLFLSGISISNTNERSNVQSSSIPNEINNTNLSTGTNFNKYLNNRSLFYRRQLIRERNALLRKQEIEKQKQARKEEFCRISERRARSASQARQRKVFPEMHVSLSAISHGARKTESTRLNDSANSSSQLDGEAQRQAQIERLSQKDEEIRNMEEQIEEKRRIERLKQADEEKRIVTMATANRREEQAKRVAETKELHILETRRLAYEAARLREEIRRAYQLDSFDKVAKETEIRNRIGL